MAVRDLLQTLAEAVVENPSDVSVVETEEDGAVVLELTVHADDYGRVIGRNGRTAQAIRTVVKAAASDDRKVFVDIVE
jgi:predicted RNA-binding protein YlqC (UPF0109 family)